MNKAVSPVRDETVSASASGRCAERDLRAFGEELREHRDDGRIELRAGAALELRQCVRGGLRGGVRAGGEHGVERVADGDDASAQGDLVAGEPVWIAAAVERLVRGADEPRGRGERGGRGDDPLAA